MAAKLKQEALVTTREGLRPGGFKDLKAAKTMKEHTENLVKLVQSYKDRGDGRERLEATLHHLKSKRLRHATNASAFLKHGGLDALLQFARCLQQAREEDRALLCLLWGTVGNLCALNNHCCNKVAELASKSLCTMLAVCSDAGILSTVARTVGNLAGNSIFLSAVRRDWSNLMHALVHTITLHQDHGCLQSVLRAFRKLVLQLEVGEEAILCQVLPALAACSQNPNGEVALAALSTLETFMSVGSPEVTATLWNKSTEPLKHLVNCVSREDFPLLSQNAVHILSICAKCSDGKAALSRVGCIGSLLGHLSRCTHGAAAETVDTLCILCRDVRCRQIMRDDGGLQLLIEMLQDDAFSLHHEAILAALICYYFDENVLRFMMQRLGLVKSLAHHLSLMASEMRNSFSYNPCSVIVEGAPCEVWTGNNTPSSLTSDLVETGSEVYHSGMCPSIRVDDSPRSVLSGVSGNGSGASGCGLCDGASPQIQSSRSASPEIFHDPIPSDRSWTPVQSDSSSTNLPDPNVDNCNDLVLKTVTQFAPDSAPSSTPKQKTCVNYNFESSSLMPANFIDSLLSMPSPYAKTPPVQPDPLVDLNESQSTIEKKVVLLLSRVSHLHDCQSLLAGSDSLPAILDYFLTGGSSSVPCYKVLHRLFTNPLCFQNCLMNHAPSLVFAHMSRVEPLVSPVISEPRPPTEPHPLANQFLSPPYCPSPSPSSVHHQDVCMMLFDRLVGVAESPYGQGEVAHMLLRGSGSEIVAAVLSLGLLHRSRTVCERMLIQYGGLHYLMLLARGEVMDNTPSLYPDRVQTMAIETLLFLAHSFHQQAPSRKRCHSFVFGGGGGGGGDGQSPASKRSRRDSINTQSIQSLWTPPSFQQRLPEEPTNAAAVSPKSLIGPSVCRYRDSDHCPFDLSVKIVNEGTTHCYQVHRQVLAETSEVFAVMLTGGYLESSSDEVTLCRVSPEAFETVLHHMYKCSWRGSGCGHRGRGPDINESGLCEDSHMTEIYMQQQVLEDDLIEGITSCLSSDAEKERISHTLLVLALANRYFIPSLLSACEQDLLGCVGFDNLVPVFLYSQLHQSKALAEACVNMLIDMPRCQLQVDVFRDLVESCDREIFLSMIVARFQF